MFYGIALILMLIRVVEKVLLNNVPSKLIGLLLKANDATRMCWEEKVLRLMKYKNVWVELRCSLLYCIGEIQGVPGQMESCTVLSL